MLWTILSGMSLPVRMTELCINLPSGGFLSLRVFPPFKFVFVAQGIVTAAGCCVGVWSRHVGTVLFGVSHILLFLHINNDIPGLVTPTKKAPPHFHAAVSRYVVTIHQKQGIPSCP